MTKCLIIICKGLYFNHLKALHVINNFTLTFLCQNIISWLKNKLQKGKAVSIVVIKLPVLKSSYYSYSTILYIIASYFIKNVYMSYLCSCYVPVIKSCWDIFLTVSICSFVCHFFSPHTTYRGHSFVA